MKRPVAASAAADAAVNAPHAIASHARRLTSGEVSSGSRALTLAAPAAAVVVLPARATAGAAGAAGLAGGGAGAAGGAEETAGGRGAPAAGGFVSSAMIL